MPSQMLSQERQREISHTHTHTDTHTETQTHAQTQTHTHTHRHTRTDTHTHSQTHTFTHTQTHTHTQERQMQTEAGIGETGPPTRIAPSGTRNRGWRGALPPRASRGRTLPRPSSDFSPAELRESISMVLRHPVCGNLQPEETNISSHAVVLSMQDKIC